MTGMDDIKSTLHRYLQAGREAVVWKLEGLTEYDMRRPLVPTGTNLLGLVKHLASVELGYFGDCFGRPHGEALPQYEEGAAPNADMWATPEEPSEAIIAMYRRAWSHSDATIEALSLDSSGHVPWWGDANPVTLHWILIHVATETHRHAGHADLVRELIDGAAGLREQAKNLPEVDAAWWESYRAKLQEVAEGFRE